MPDVYSFMQQSLIKVLVVDDEEMQLKLIDGFLSMSTLANYEVSWAANSSEALAYIDAHMCDVCLLDYNLGGEDGLDLLQIINGLHDAPPVIFMFFLSRITS